MVHASRGSLRPARRTCCSEVAIVCRPRASGAAAPDDAAGRLGRVDGRLRPASATHIEPRGAGLRRLQRQSVGAPGGFVLPHGAARPPHLPHRRPARRKFTVNALDAPEVPAGPAAAADDALPRPVQHHDLRPRRPLPRDQGRPARGASCNPDDLAALGLADGDIVDLGRRVDRRRRAARPRASAWSPTRTARGCAAAYYPETNVLVPLDSVADTSNTPTSKSIVIRLERAAVPRPV